MFMRYIRRALTRASILSVAVQLGFAVALTAQSPNHHLRLRVEINTNGGARVVGATVVPGTARFCRSMRGDHLYEVMRGPTTLAVEAFPDPFERRGGFGTKKNQDGHYIDQVAAANVLIKVPGLGLNVSDLAGLDLRIYRFKPDAPRQPIDAKVVAQLKTQQLLETVVAGRLGVTDLTASAERPRTGTTVRFDLFAWTDPGQVYVLASSLGTGPIPLGRHLLYLTPDVLFLVSSSGLNPNVFSGYRGRIGQDGRASAALLIPAIPGLAGLDVYTAFVTLGGPQGVLSVSPTWTVTLQ